MSCLRHTSAEVFGRELPYPQTSVWRETAMLNVQTLTLYLYESKLLSTVCNLEQWGPTSNRVPLVYAKGSSFFLLWNDLFETNILARRSDWIFNSCAWGWSEIQPMPKTVHFMCTCLVRLDSRWLCCWLHGFNFWHLKILWDPSVNLQTVGVLFNSFRIRCRPSWGRLIVRMNNLCIFSKTGGPLNLPRYLQHGMMRMQCNSAHVSSQLINLCFTHLKFHRRVNHARNRKKIEYIIIV